MDLSSIEGITEAQREAILALHTADVDGQVSGLKANRDELLEEKRQAKEAADEARRLAKEESDKLAIATARSANDLKALEETITSQYSEKLTAAERKHQLLNERIVGSERDGLVGDLANIFASPDAGKMILKQMVDVSITDDGTATTFKGMDGSVITTDKAVFADWLKGQDAFKSLIKGVDSSGGGAAGGSGSGGAAPKDSRAAKVAEIDAKFGK
jgi:hypothetical protein